MLRTDFVLKHSTQAALFSFLLLFIMAACGNSTSNSSTPTPGTTPTPTPGVTPTPTAPAPATQFKVTGVDMAVNPTSVVGLTCGTNMTVTYTATFHVPANSPGGTVLFGYTVNNGRGENMASITFAPGETTKTYSFTWKGNLPPDHTYPEPGGVNVTSPNQLISPLVGPTGSCSTVAFKVTGVNMAVNPTSIAGKACGANVTVTYTATFHVAPGSSGGTVQFGYTVNNGRAERMASINFAPGETTKTYTFTWQGNLPSDHTYPEPGGVNVTSPNQLVSSLVGPTGTCS